MINQNNYIHINQLKAKKNSDICKGYKLPKNRHNILKIVLHLKSTNIPKYQ